VGALDCASGPAGSRPSRPVSSIVLNFLTVFSAARLNLQLSKGESLTGERGNIYVACLVGLIREGKRV